MKVTYTNEDFENMMQCYLESGRNLANARLAYFLRYGVEPSINTMENALSKFGDAKCYGGNSESVTIDPNAIKKEDTSPSTCEVAIKQERLDPADYTQNEIENQENTVDSKLLCPAIVYTTKLDDMMILNKDFKRLDVEDIIENIILESKPTFEKMPTECKNPLINFINPFFKLVENIRKFNEIANNNSFNSSNVVNSSPSSIERSNSSIMFRKQLRIVLEDCKLKPGHVVKVRPKGRRYTIVKVIPPLDYHEDSSEVSESFSTQLNSKIIKLKKGAYKSLIFLNKETNSTDIYIVNKVPSTTSYCSLNYLLDEDNMPLNSVVMDNCCWFGRELALRNIIGWPANSKITTEIIKKPHSCPPDKCICCCKNKYTTFNNCVTSNYDRLDNNRLATDINETPIWVKNLYSKSCQDDENSCLTNALNYTRNKHLANINSALSSSGNKVVPIQIQFTNNKTRQTESYYVEENGNISKHVEENFCHNETSPSLLRHISSQESFMVCCWWKRNWLLWKMQSKYSQSVINLMRTPHNCQGTIQGEECTCCCKYSLSVAKMRYCPRSEDVAIPVVKKLVHSKNYTSKGFLHRRNICKLSQPLDPKVVVNKCRRKKKSLLDKETEPNAAPSTSKTTSPAIQFVSTSTSVKASEIGVISVKTKEQLSSKRVSKSVKKPKQNTKSTEKECASTATEVNNTPAVVQQNQPTSLENPLLPNNLLGMIDAENQDPTVNSLVKSILTRFRDVRLTMTPDGDVSAELNMPIQQLSTAELKILSAILAHAKEQVKSLKENSETIVNPSSMPNMFSDNTGTPNSKDNTSTLNTTAPKATIASNSSPNVPSNSNTPLAGPLNSSVPRPMLNVRAATPKYQPTLTVHPLDLNQKPRVKMADVYSCFTNIAALKLQGYLRSCKSYLDKKTYGSVPKINNIFSLKSNDVQLQTGNTTVPLQAKVLYAVQPGTSGMKRRYNRTYLNLKKARTEKEGSEEAATSSAQTSLHPSNANTSEPPNVSVPENLLLRSTLLGKPIYRVVPQPMPSLYKTSLQDLVSTPFVPPTFVPNNIINPTSTINQKAVLITLPEQTPLSHLKVGPAYSLSSNVLDSDDEENANMDNEECILGA